MNKLLVVNNQVMGEGEDFFILSQQVYITKEVHFLLESNDQAGDFSFHIAPNISVSIDIFGRNSKNKIHYILQEGSKLIVNHLVFENSDSIIIDLTGEHAKVEYFYSTVSELDQTYQISVHHDASNTESNLVNHGITTRENRLTFNINGFVPKQSNDCICNQDSKIIYRKNNCSIIQPNLWIENYNVVANHAAYIGTFKEKDLFYLMSRGIKEIDCYHLLVQSFLLGKMQLEEERKSQYIEMIEMI